MVKEFLIESNTGPVEKITIPKKLYDELMRDARFLALLEAYGVDNWEGWDRAIEEFNRD